MEELIIKAGQQQRTVLINYTEKDGTNEGWREIEPYGFRINKSIKLFFGYDLKKCGVRSFIVDSINGVKITKNSYHPRWAIEL